MQVPQPEAAGEDPLVPKHQGPTEALQAVTSLKAPVTSGRQQSLLGLGFPCGASVRTPIPHPFLSPSCEQMEVSLLVPKKGIWARAQEGPGESPWLGNPAPMTQFPSWFCHL